MTTLTWLLYISTNQIAPDRLEHGVAEIVGTACGRNGARGIIGAMIATHTHLA